VQQHLQKSAVLLHPIDRSPNLIAIWATGRTISFNVGEDQAVGIKGFTRALHGILGRVVEIEENAKVLWRGIEY
jgi:hypothetical protein